MSSGPRGSDAGAASSSAPGGEAWPPLQGALQAGFAKVKQQLTRLVFQIDAEQEARMRAYLDQTYGDSFEEGRRGRDRPIQMNSLRPPKPVERVVPPPTSLDEEVARRLYDQLDAAGRQKASTPAGTPRSSGQKPQSGEDAKS